MTSDVPDTMPESVTHTITDSILYHGYSIGTIVPLSDTSLNNVTGTFTERGSATGYGSYAVRPEGMVMPHRRINTDFSFIILSAAFLLLTVLYVFGRKSLASFITGTGIKHGSEKVSDRPSGTFSWEPAIRNIFSVLNISLFTAIALLLNDFIKNYNFPGFIWLTCIIAGIFMAAIVLRYLSFIFLAGITGCKPAFREYMNVIYNTWFADALILFILNAIILFAPVSKPLIAIITGLIATAIMLIIRELRLIVIFLNSHISLFYYILYLCALEVLPVLVILKLFGIY